jgi:multicomponent Na+:H+ antiporter subunit C
MEILLALVVGGLYTAGVYLLLQPSPVKLIIGLGILTNAVNLLIFTAAGLTRGRPPLIEEGLSRPIGQIADPLPQALVLTAIVIAFGVLAFALVLFSKTAQITGADNFDEMRTTDP